MRKIIIALLMLCSIPALAQVDRHDVRAGNRKFRKDEFKEAEINYRKAVLKDSLSVAGGYNLASTLYRQEDYEGAGKALETAKDVAAVSPHSTQYYYNMGDVALQKKDYGAAMEAFKQALLRDPSDMDAKENYIYAKLMKQNEDQNGGGGGQDNDQNNDQNQDQNNDQNQDQNQNGDNDQDKNQDQGQNGDRPQQQPQPQEQKISPQQAQQMLQAIQAKEKETQDKVKKEKADLLQSRQKEKNW